MKNFQAIETKAYDIAKLVEKNSVDGKLPFAIGGNLVRDDIAIEVKTKASTGDLIVTVFVTYDETIRRVSVIPYDMKQLVSTIQDMIAPLRLAHLAQESIAVYQNRIAAMTQVMTHIIGE